jgi:hypothetical protein
MEIIGSVVDFSTFDAGQALFFYSPILLYDLITGLHTPNLSLNCSNVRLFGSYDKFA